MLDGEKKYSNNNEAVKEFVRLANGQMAKRADSAWPSD